MNLKEARFKAGLTQWELANRSGVNPSKISLIERGHVAPRRFELTALAEALRVSPESVEWPQRSRFGARDAMDTISNAREITQ